MFLTFYLDIVLVILYHLQSETVCTLDGRVLVVFAILYFSDYISALVSI